MPLPYSEKNLRQQNLYFFLHHQVRFKSNLSQGTNMQKWSQSLIWGMGITVIAPITVSIFGLALIAFNTLTLLGLAVLLWGLYFYAIFLLCTRPHDERFVQIYMLVMSILTLPWSILLVFAFFASATKAHNQRVSSNMDTTKDG
jgi:hypothetical protein